MSRTTCGILRRLYNVPPPTGRQAGGVQSTVVAPVLPIREDPPSCQEVEKVVSELKGPSELLGFVGSQPSSSRWVESA